MPVGKNFKMYRVDKNVPIPTKWTKKGKVDLVAQRSAYPWDKMEPGDSFFVPYLVEENLADAADEGSPTAEYYMPIRALNRLQSAVAYQRRMKPDQEYVVRVSPDVPGWRVWRIK